MHGRERWRQRLRDAAHCGRHRGTRWRARRLAPQRERSRRAARWSAASAALRPSRKATCPAARATRWRAERTDARVGGAAGEETQLVLAQLAPEFLALLHDLATELGPPAALAARALPESRIYPMWQAAGSGRSTHWRTARSQPAHGHRARVAPGLRPAKGGARSRWRALHAQPLGPRGAVLPQFRMATRSNSSRATAPEAARAAASGDPPRRRGSRLGKHAEGDEQHRGAHQDAAG